MEVSANFAGKEARCVERAFKDWNENPQKSAEKEAEGEDAENDCGEERVLPILQSKCEI